MVPSATEISIQQNDVKKKTFFLMFISFLSAFIYWRVLSINLVGDEIKNGVGWPAVICPFLFFIVYMFNEKIKQYAWIAGPIMAMSLGIFLGAISGFFEKNAEGLIIQAVLTTFASVFSILFLYKNKWITVNDKFLKFTTFVFCTLSWIGIINFILSYIVLEWHSLFGGVTLIAITLNAIIILLAFLVFTIDLNIIDESIKNGSISKEQAWTFSTELLVDIGWIYFAFVFLILRLRGRKYN